MMNTQQVPNTTPKSVRLNRAFVSPAWDENIETLKKSLASAKEALPEVESAYRPSGRISVLARIIMILAIPFFTLLVVAALVLLLLVFEANGGVS